MCVSVCTKGDNKGTIRTIKGRQRDEGIRNEKKKREASGIVGWRKEKR